MIKQHTLHIWIISGLIMALFALVIIFRIKYFTLSNLISIILFIGFCVLIPETIFFSKKGFRFFKIKIEINQIIDIIASGIALIILFLGANRTFFDDVGFTLRYMDNFSNGHFYCYNPIDGPVFGISGFLNTVFCGAIAYLKLFSSHNILLLSNVVGVFAISFLSLRIARVYLKKAYLILLIWFLLMFCVKDLLSIAFSGIETPFHLAIILAAIYFMLLDKIRLMWLFLALSVISKLDAVPIAFVVGLIYLLINRKELLRCRPFWCPQQKNKTIQTEQQISTNTGRNIYNDLILWGVVPLIIWLIFMFIVFGSPFPQSAFAKVNFYPHPDTHWFPFLTGYLHDHYLFPVFILFLIVFTIHQAFVFIKPADFRSTDLIFGYGFMASLILYYFYNPGEKMMWYYGVPSFFMLFQIGISLVKITPGFAKNHLNPTILFVFVGLFVFLRNDISASNIWLKKNMNITENERILIGEYLGEISQQTDTLMSKHGHLSRHFKGYVIDNAGLNSKLATDYKLNTDSLLKAFQPKYVINHAWKNYIEIMNNNNYRLKDAFYDLSLYDSPNWLLFERINQAEGFNRTIEPIEISKINGIEKNFELNYVTRVNGTKLTINTLMIKNFPENEPIKVAERIVLGVIKQQDEFDLNIRIYQYDNIMEEKSIRINSIGSGISRFVQTVEIPLSYWYLNTNPIEFSRKDGQKIALINPFIEYINVDQE